MKVVIPQDITAAGKDYLSERRLEWSSSGSAAARSRVMKKEVADADAILASTAPYPAEVLDAAPRLKVIGRHGIGVDNIDVDWCTRARVWVCFAPHLQCSLRGRAQPSDDATPAPTTFHAFVRGVRQRRSGASATLYGCGSPGQDPWSTWAWAASAPWWQSVHGTPSGHEGHRL